MEPLNVGPPATPGNSVTQYLSFLLGSDEYAVEILRVCEIRGIGPVTPLPLVPGHVKGVMNLRGSVVPVIDLRAAIGLPRAIYGKFTVIVVLSVGERTMGFVVDSVCDVLSASSKDVDKVPDLGDRVDTSLARGIVRTENRFVILLDIDRIVRAGEGAAT